MIVAQIPFIVTMLGWSVGVLLGAVAAWWIAARRSSEMRRRHGRFISALDDRQRLLEAQLASQQLVLQSMTTGILALDMAQRVVSMNAAAERLFAVPGGAARGRLLQEVVRSPELHAFVNDALAAGGSARREVTLDSASAGILELAAAPMLDPRGAPAGLLIAADDVTAERRLESMRSDFAANVSHELRTPITNIKGYVETLLEIGWEDPARARQFLGVVQENARRLAQLVEDILALSSLEQRQAPQRLQFEEVSLDDLIGRVVDEIRGTADARQIRIDHAAPEGARIFASRSLLGQAVANLVQNAIQYSPPRTAVRIDVETNDDTTTISVRDQGSGISEKHLPRLFERFYRVDAGRAREAGGTGLGLAIVKHIAMAHGGRVSVQSRLGEGSVFRLHLPNAPAAAETDD